LARFAHVVIVCMGDRFMSLRLPSLQQFFHHQLQRGFHARGLNDPPTVDYVADMLARFTQTSALYAVADASGRPIEHIIDLLIESSERRSRSARQITRHIGEFTLFMSGIFRERVRARGQLNYYRAQGQGAFWRCAATEPNERGARLYRSLGEQFESISNVLDHLRRVQWPLSVRSTDSPLRAFWQA